MAFEDQTQLVILDRMLQKVDEELDREEGSIVYDMLAPTSIELEQAYMELDNVFNAAFADTAYGQYLDMRAADVGLIRKPATQSEGELLFEGADGTIIPEGTTVSNDSGEYMAETIEEKVILGGRTIVKAVFTETGTIGNVPSGTFTKIVEPVISDVKVSNPNKFDYAYDEETDEDFLTRYKIRTQNVVAPGNDAYYKLLATEIQGVADARVYPRWNGKGTVKLVLLSPEKRTPSQYVIEKVKENINKNLMLGADVTVEGVQEVSIDVEAKLILTPGNTIAPIEDIEYGIEQYLNNLAFNDLIIRYSRITDVLLDTPNVLDYENVRVNNATSNIIINDNQVPVLGKLTITV